MSSDPSPHWVSTGEGSRGFKWLYDDATAVYFEIEAGNALSRLGNEFFH